VARHLKRAADIGLAAINVEGGLISPEKLAEIAATTPDAKAATDYHCPKGTSLRDEITRYFRIGQPTSRHLPSGGGCSRALLRETP
jgi:hypothetical protein